MKYPLKLRIIKIYKTLALLPLFICFDSIALSPNLENIEKLSSPNGVAIGGVSRKQVIPQDNAKHPTRGTVRKSATKTKLSPRKASSKNTSHKTPKNSKLTKKANAQVIAAKKAKAKAAAKLKKAKKTHAKAVAKLKASKNGKVRARAIAKLKAAKKAKAKAAANLRAANRSYAKAVAKIKAAQKGNKNKPKANSVKNTNSPPSTVNINPIRDLGIAKGYVCFRVRAYSNRKVSDFSDAVCTYIKNSKDFLLSWTPSSSPIIGYHLYFGKSANKTDNFITDVM